MVNINNNYVTCGEDLAYTEWQFLSVSIRMNADALTNDVRIMQGVAGHDHIYYTKPKEHFTYHEEKKSWYDARVEC